MQHVTRPLAVFGILLVANAPVTADDQIAPNPNPVGNTITIDTPDYAYNNEEFHNYGTVVNNGYFDNNRQFYNEAGAVLRDYGSFFNWMLFENHGVIEILGGDFISADRLFSYGPITLDGEIINAGVLNQSSTIIGSGSFECRYGGVLACLGVFDIGGDLISDSYSDIDFYASAAIGGRVQNKGYLDATNLAIGGVFDNFAPGYLQVDNLSVGGDVTNDSHLTCSSDFETTASFVNAGWGQANLRGRVYVGQSLTNSGRLEIHGDAEVLGDFESTGIAMLERELTVGGNLTTSGLLECQSGIVVEGTAHLDGEVFALHYLNVTGDTAIAPTGRVDAWLDTQENLVNEGEWVLMGSNLAHGYVNGAFTNTGTIEFEIWDTTDFDLIRIHGDAALDGTVRAVFYDTPEPGSVFQIFDAESIVSSTATLEVHGIDPALVMADFAHGRLVIVPAPNAGVILGLGVLAAGRRRR
jgi:cytoskeletal protein CcmA (bactofilin family)